LIETHNKQAKHNKGTLWIETHNKHAKHNKVTVWIEIIEKSAHRQNRTRGRSG
jgi:hypothetical protein